MMGPGWGQQLLMTVGLMCAVVVVLKLLDVAASHQEPETPDPFLRLWRRYEEGDLTRQEFERLRRLARVRAQERGAPAASGLGAVGPDQSSAANS